MSKYGNYSFTTDLTSNERREIGQFCLDYCLKTIGLPKRKHVPKFSIVKGRTSGTYGIYNPENETIYVNTFIHEFTHHTQNLKNYESLLHKVGYRNHPLEVEACRKAKEHKQTCLELFRKYKMSYE